MGNYDARSFAAEVDVPTAVVVTTRDRLVRPRKQRQLARAIPEAEVFEIAADHDAPLVVAEPFRAATEAAVKSVLARVDRAEAVG